MAGFTGTTSEETFDGDSAVTSFAYTQNTATGNDSWVKAAHIDAAGTVTDLTYGTHYTVSGVGGTGGITVTYPGASSPAPYDVELATGASILIDIQPPHDQDFDPEHNGTYSPSTIGNVHDKLMRIVHKLTSDLSRTLRVSRGSATDASTLTYDDFTKQKVLLDSEVAYSGATVTLTATNWPATYDCVELEIAKMRPNTADGTLKIEPLDGGVAVATSLKNATSERLGGANAFTSATDWILPDTDNTTVAAMSGSLKIWAPDNVLVGNGLFSHGVSASAAVGGFTIYVHRTVVPASASWDGFEITHSLTTFAGTFRLWGHPKT